MLKIKNSHNHSRDDKASQIVSWGHWFTLFNIFLVLMLGSRYLLIADWPATFMGRFYAIISSLGHFSFLTFVVYLVLLFPLSFLIHSPRWQRIIATLVATLGITLLLIDLEVFYQFRMHLNLTIWDILTSSDDTIFSGNWQKLFIFVPLVFMLETLFAIWSWRKLRSLSKRRKWAKPLVILFISCFLSSHLIHIWADANFYRPITMQRASLPLSYPLTARHFLEKYGFITPNNYAERVEQEGNPFAMAIEYPLSDVSLASQTEPYNLLVITFDGVYYPSIINDMPFLAEFAKQKINFTQHYSSSNKENLGVFSLFYGLDPNYYNSILAGHESSVLLNSIAKQQYNLGLFSSDGFASSFYRYALLSNFTLSNPVMQPNKTTTAYWQEWLSELNKTENNSPWFSLINYRLMDSRVVNDKNKPYEVSLKNYTNKAKELDKEIEKVITYLTSQNALDNTVIVITSDHGLNMSDNKMILKSTSNDLERVLLQVPLVVAWPTHAQQEISTPTTHVDIMRTLMQNLLMAKSSPAQYSQGENLFELSNRAWLTAGNEDELAALYTDKTIVIDSSGRYKIYNEDNQLLPNEKLSLSTFLQLITANRRFMVTN